MNSSTCVFCRIVENQIPASIIYQDKKVIAFLDIRPLTEGHTLVIPKAHLENIFVAPLEIICYIHGIVKQVATTIKKATNADGISIIQQNGKAAGQEIFHLHIHIIPRYKGQKLPSFNEVTEVNREKLNQTAARIRSSL